MGLVLRYKKSSAQPEFTVGAAIVGDTLIGSTLTCTYTAAKAQTVTVRWFRHVSENAVGVEVGTGVNYPLTGDDLNTVLRAVVTASNNAGAVQSTSAFSGTVVAEAPPDPPTVVTAATISGTVEVGATLTVSYDFDGESTVAIQWYSYETAGKTDPVALGTSATQALTAAEDGRFIGCVVTAYNNAGGTPSEAAVVGPVASEATSAPEVTSAAAIALDDGSVGYNEGEYIICNASFTGWTSTPTFTWYKCDAGKTNPEELTGAGLAAINPLPVSQPNAFRGAIFLATSLGLNAAGKYVYCVASATNSEGTTTSESAAVGPIGAIQGTAISAATVGDGPYYLPSANTTYYLTEDITTPGTAIIMNKASQRLNLNGHTITFNDEAPAVTNGDFEDGVTGWDFTPTGNPGGGSGVQGTATYCDIYTSSNFEDDYNRKRLVTGTKSLRFKNAALANNGVYSYVSQAITLETGKSYCISFTCYRGGTAGLPFARIRHAVDGGQGTAFWSQQNNIGMQYVEAIVHASHSPAEYTLDVGVVGATGASGDCYIDDVRVTRTRCAGVYITDLGDQNNTRAAAVTITNAGSGYADGTYNGVAGTYSTGGSPVTAPTFNITVSGGQVTAATVASGGTFIFYNSTFTVSNTLLGGSGSGLVLTVSKLSHFWGRGTGTTSYTLGDNVASVVPLDQTTRFNTASNCVVKNGTITQGQNGGTWPTGVYVTYHDHGVYRTTMTLTGPNASCLKNENTTARYINIRDCTFNCNWTVIGDRSYSWGSACRYIGGNIARNTFLNYPIGGIVPNGGGNDNGLICYGNTFRAKMRWTNGRAVTVMRANQRVYDNIIDNTGDYYGRGLACGSDYINGTAQIYNNRISCQPSRLNGEYGGISSFGDHAVQLEGIKAGATILLYGNEITGTASGSQTQNGQYIVCNALTINGLWAGGTINSYGNTVTATASGSGYATCLNIGGAASSEIRGTLTFSYGDNLDTFSSNSMYCRGAGDLITEIVGNVNWTVPGTNEARPLVAEYEATLSPISLDFRDCVYGSGALAVIAASKVWEDPRWNTTTAPTTHGSYFVRWTIAFETGQDGAAVAVKHNGSTIASGTANANGTCAIEVPQYQMQGATITNFNTLGLTVEATKDALTGSASFTCDAAKTVTVSMS